MMLDEVKANETYKKSEKLDALNLLSSRTLMMMKDGLNHRNVLNSIQQLQNSAFSSIFYLNFYLILSTFEKFNLKCIKKVEQKTKTLNH